MTDGMQRAMVGITALDVDADDEEGLYRLLGARLKMLERDPSIAGDFAPRTIAPAELGITIPDLFDFGRQAFVRIASLGHNLVCGTEANQGFHLQRLLTSLGTDTATVTAAVATLLIGQLAIAPAVAGIVATIIVGKVAPSSLAALCKAWGAKVTPTGQTTTPTGPTTPPAVPTTPPAPTTPPSEPAANPPPAEPPANPPTT